MRRFLISIKDAEDEDGAVWFDGKVEGGGVQYRILEDNLEPGWFGEPTDIPIPELPPLTNFVEPGTRLTPEEPILPDDEFPDLPFPPL